jgi:FkbM family methyltransferase
VTFRKTLKRFVHSYCPGFRGWFYYYGTRVYFPPGAWIFDLAVQQGIYEADLLRLISGLVSDSGWYFDIGANIGLMSVPLLRAHPGCHVLSLEPSPNSWPSLQKTWSKSLWKERWLIKNEAAGEERGQADFFISSRSFAGFDGLRNTGRVPNIDKRRVEVTTLDQEWIDLGRPPVSVIKLDVEGAELKAITGGRELVQSTRPYIVVEWYSENFRAYGYDGSELLRLGENLGYDVMSIPTMSIVSSRSMMFALLQTTSAFMLVPK